MGSGPRRSPVASGRDPDGLPRPPGARGRGRRRGLVEAALWGVVGEEFLPPLKLTLDEAMAVVLSARLMVRYADKYDPDLAAAFEKLEAVLPRPLAEHVERTLDVLAQHPATRHSASTSIA